MICNIKLGNIDLYIDEYENTLKICGDYNGENFEDNVKITQKVIFDLKMFVEIAEVSCTDTILSRRISD